jgi:hypothetical protein
MGEEARRLSPWTFVWNSEIMEEQYEGILA